MWSKRRYTFNTIIGCVSGAVPPLISWAAVDPGLHIIAFVLFLIMFIWQTPHFFSISYKKTKDYSAASIPMLPAVHGFAITKRQIVVYITLFIATPVFYGVLGPCFYNDGDSSEYRVAGIGVQWIFYKNDLKWANKIFVYSLNYLVVLCLLMVVVTMELPFN